MAVRACLSCLACCLLLSPAPAQADKVPPAAADREPVLRLEAGGPTALLTGLAFAPTEQELYAAGFDKVVHTWTLGRDGSFRLGKDAYRVPVGPGLTGSINNIALSSDGVWLAISSRGVVRNTASHRELGIWVPSPNLLSREMREDEGAIVVYNTRTGDARQLRGHRGRVGSIAFAPQRPGSPPLLASIAREFVQGDEYQAVVRLWDVDRGTQVAALTQLPDPVTATVTRQPRLAVWRSGAKGNVIRTALACDDGLLRVWEVKDDVSRPVVSVKDNLMNDTIVQVSDEDRILTASVRGAGGVLTLWDVSSGTPKWLDEVNLPAGTRARALAVFPAKAGGPVNRAAVVLRSEVKGTNEFRLLLFDLAKLKTPPLASQGLWIGPAVTPVLAVSPGGRFLAAAGNEEHEVHVFAVKDLLAGDDQRTRLRGAGTLIHHAIFAKNGKRVGILLSKTPRAKDGPAPRADLVFDFTNRELSETTVGWERDVPDEKGWDVEAAAQTDPKELLLRFQYQNNEVGSVRIKSSQAVTLTAFALLADPKRPLVAAALMDAGQPLLRLYDVRTGEHIRQLTGHVNRIHSLAFSRDGKLLVSTAADQTVCVWGLADLDQLLGKKGMLPGFVVSDNGAGVVVAEINDTYLADANRKTLERNKVAVGDIIEGFITAGKREQPPLKTLRDFYDRVFQATPGKTITLRIRKRGDVTLQVGQATDEQKPLLTLFITRPGPGAPRQWLGWNPVGPYDFSDPTAERLLGWQQNTGDPKQPAQFAQAAQYRKVYYKPDILKYLVQHGSTGPALEAWKKDHPDRPAEPKLTLWIKELGPEASADPTRPLVLEQPQATLRAVLQEVAADQVRSFTWERDGKESGKFTRGPDDEWTADLSGLEWKRGEHRLRVALQTAAFAGQEFTRELFVTYAPPRPSVRAVAALPGVVDQADYLLQVEVVPGRGQTVEVVVQRNGEDLDKPETIKEPRKLLRKVRLQEGLNRLRVLARNRDTGDADALSVDVRYEMEKPAPQVTLGAVVPADGAPLLLDPELLKKPIVVDTPNVRIEGTVESLAPLANASWLADAPNDKRKPLTIGDAKDPKRWPFTADVVVPEPGKPLKVTFFGSTPAGKEGQQTITLLYAPRLPELRPTAPLDNQPFIEGRDKPLITLEGDLTWSAHPQPCTAQVIINDKEQGEPIPVQVGAARFSGSVLLQPGENWIQVRLKNPWRETTTLRRLVTWRRPPTVKLIAPQKAETPFVNVVAEVETPTELPLTMLNVQNQETPANRFALDDRKAKDGRTIYRIVLKELALQKGRNLIRVLAANRDGWALKPDEVEIDFEEPAAPPAEVTLLSPAKEANVDTPEFPVEFLVRSRSPLRKVELLRNSVVVWTREAKDLADVPKNAAGEFVLRETRNVTLQPGPNVLKVVARNAGGEQASPAQALTLQSGPARVIITHLDVAGAEVKPRETINRTVFFPAVARDQVIVHGRVEWGPASDGPMAKVDHVRVCVNGFQQLPARLEKAAGNARERAFKMAVRLTRASGNEVVVKLPDLAEEAASRNHCIIDCKQPDAAVAARRTAHLLVVDTTREPEEKVVAQVMQALQATPAAKGHFHKAGFADGRIYGPLIGAAAAPERIHILLQSIKENVRKQAALGPVNDVVIIYFRGGEMLDGRSHFLRTTDRERDPDLLYSGLSMDFLTNFCSQDLGAQLVLLDVTRDVPPKAANAPLRDKVLEWPEDPNVAVVRYSWNGPPQKQAADARLITDWTHAEAKKKKLGDVIDLLSTKFEPVSQALRPSVKFKNALTYSLQLPAGLAEVVLGK